MERFTITEDGRLIHHTKRYESVPRAERPYPDDDGLLGFIGSIRGIDAGDVEVPLHGDLNFYENDEKGDWWEYTARFTEGRLSRIWLLSHRAKETEGE